MLFSGEDTDNDHSDDIGKQKDLEKKEDKKEDKKQPSDIEKRATAFYFHCTGKKEGQRGWSLDEYKAFLKREKEDGKISSDYGKNWTLQDIEYLESVVEALPF
jgi:hypothetical protein